MVTIREDGFAEFSFYRPGVAHVHLAGDFNQWRTNQLKMVHQGNGTWVLKLALPAGDYRFRYVADGLWYTDYAAFGVEPGRFGYDSLLRVPQQALKFTSAPVKSAPSAAAAA